MNSEIVYLKFSKTSIDTLSSSEEAIRLMIQEEDFFKNQEFDSIVYATGTPDYIGNSTGVLIQSFLGLKNCAIYDVNTNDIPFCTSLKIANSLIASGYNKLILVIYSEVLSNFKETSSTDKIIIGIVKKSDVSNFSVERVGYSYNNYSKLPIYHGGSKFGVDESVTIYNSDLVKNTLETNRFCNMKQKIDIVNNKILNMSNYKWIITDELFLSESFLNYSLHVTSESDFIDYNDSNKLSLNNKYVIVESRNEGIIDAIVINW